MARKLTHEEASEVMLAAGLEPLEPYRGSGKPWKCRCQTCGEAVEPSRMNILQGHKGCGYCAGILTTGADAAAAMRSAGFEPLEPYRAKNTPWRCQCGTCGEVLERTLTQSLRGTGCPYCSGLAVDPRKAVQLMRDAGYEPLEPFSRSTDGWRSRCIACQNEAFPTLTRVKRGEAGCGWCAGLKIAPEAAVTAMRSAGLEPLEPYRHSRAKWPCKCLHCGRAVEPTYGDVANGSSGCGYCSGNRVDPVAATALMRLAGFEPLVPYVGSKTCWLARCLSCNEVSTPTYGNVRMGSRCRFCVEGGGYNPSRTGWLYVLCGDINYSVPSRRPWHGSVTQFGITNNLPNRLRDHRRTGFLARPVIAIESVDGWLIANLESAIKVALADSGVVPCAMRGERGFPGATESFGSDQLPIGEFITLVESLYAGLLLRVAA